MKNAVCLAVCLSILLANSVQALEFPPLTPEEMEETHTSTVTSAAFSPDGKRIVTAIALSSYNFGLEGVEFCSGVFDAELPQHSLLLVIA